MIAMMKRLTNWWQSRSVTYRAYNWNLAAVFVAYETGYLVARVGGWWTVLFLVVGAPLAIGLVELGSTLTYRSQAVMVEALRVIVRPDEPESKRYAALVRQHFAGRQGDAHGHPE